MLISDVLPAPFGPITDNSAPRSTSRSTWLTACTPPNALETLRISSCAVIRRRGPRRSRQPALPTLVVLHVAVTLPLADAGEPEVELLDVLVGGEFLRLAVEHDPAIFHDIAVLDGRERDLRVLLREQHRHLLFAVEPADDLEDLLHEPRREPHGWLVEQHQLGPRHERAPDREHLLLAARDVAGADLLSLAQPREVLVNQLEILIGCAPASSRVGSRQQVFLYRQVLEHAPPFHHLDDAPADQVRWVAPVDALA